MSETAKAKMQNPVAPDASLPSLTHSMGMYPVLQ